MTCAGSAPVSRGSATYPASLFIIVFFRFHNSLLANVGLALSWFAHTHFSPNQSNHTHMHADNVRDLITLDVQGYTREVLIDARDYADHAGRTDLGMQDVRLAVRKKQDALSAGPPSREVRERPLRRIRKTPHPDSGQTHYSMGQRFHIALAPDVTRWCSCHV